MKIYCSSCDKVQPVLIDDCRDAKTNEPFQDIVCADCHLVIASGTGISSEYERGFIDGMQKQMQSSVDRAVNRMAEQPAQQQEPVAWMYQCSADSSGPVLMQHKRDWAESGSGLWTETPLYTSPPASKPLTDEEIAKIAEKYTEPLLFRVKDFARAIEAAHGIKE